MEIGEVYQHGKYLRMCLIYYLLCEVYMFFIQSIIVKIVEVLVIWVVHDNVVLIIFDLRLLSQGISTSRGEYGEGITIRVTNEITRKGWERRCCTSAPLERAGWTP